MRLGPCASVFLTNATQGGGRQRSKKREPRALRAGRRDLVAEQTRRLGRLHDLLVGIHPGLELRLDLTTKGGLFLLARYVTPADIRGRRQEQDRPLPQDRGRPQPHGATRRDRPRRALEQPIRIPGEATAARFCRELDRQLEEAVRAHPDGTLILTLPGMGVTLTAEFLVEAGPLGNAITRPSCPWPAVESTSSGPCSATENLMCPGRPEPP